MAKAKNHYVDNAEFLAALIDYKAKYNAAIDAGDEPPGVSNYIGECILKIATHLAYRPNFINYSYRDEMILDGIENCLKYVHNFDQERSSNPFAYFTQINFYAFVRRIKREKDQAKLKGKLIREMPLEFFDIQDHDEDGQFTNAYVEFMQQNGAYEEDKPVFVRKEVTGLDQFYGESDE